MHKPSVHQRAFLAASGLVAAGLAVAGCGVSVAAGHDNAATHPASGIFVSNTVGGGLDISQRQTPPVKYVAPDNKPPAVLPAGLAAEVKAIRGAVKGGCWEDSHSGNNYGAYDQLFWWMGACNDTVAGVTVELYPSIAQARAESRHPVSDALAARYLDGGVVVDVWATAPTSAVDAVSGVHGLRALRGYSS
jgi:hypothetical protein